jgi:transmembrane sensor
MNKEEVKALLDRYREGSCSQEERAVVESWYNVTAEKNAPLGVKEDLEAVMDEIWTNVYADAGFTEDRRVYPLWKKLTVAAAVAAVTLGVWLYYTPRHPEGTRDLLVNNDIAPGKNTATLTLPDGKTIHLSDAKSGVIINKSGLKYNDQSEIASSLRFPRNDGEAVMLTASTPRGGTYQVVLPDGSKVWLNADSKISFPLHFFGSERKIILEGEAYFEVSRNKSKPFVVQTDKQEVTVLGTHFNINSYADEGSTKTTLLEGSVSVSYVSRLSSTSSRGTEGTLGHATSRDPSMLRDDGKMPESTILKPNQQSVLTGGNQIKVNQVDASLVVAWKEGQFSFQNEALESIMRKVGRWYDVDVVYEDENLRKAIIWGKVSRFENISKVLSKLQLTGQAKFKVEGRSVYVFN